MPRRAAPGNAAAIVAALSPVLRLALEEFREILNVHDWESSRLSIDFKAAAVVLEAERIEANEGVSTYAAVLLAATKLGIKPETARSWVRRHRKESRRRCVLNQDNPPRAG